MPPLLHPPRYSLQADNMGATWEMKALEGGGNGMAQTVTNTFRTSTNVFKVDEEVEVEQPDGSKQRQTLSVVSETAVQVRSGALGAGTGMQPPCGPLALATPPPPLPPCRSRAPGLTGARSSAR